MIKTEKMNLVEESAEGSIMQSQVRLPPPRYPGDFVLVYLEHRLDFNLLDYLRMTIDEQFTKTYDMFCRINNGWTITLCGYDADINLDPQIYFTHMERISQEITTFCLQWPYGIPRIVINC